MLLNNNLFLSVDEAKKKEVEANQSLVKLAEFKSQLLVKEPLKVIIPSSKFFLSFSAYYLYLMIGSVEDNVKHLFEVNGGGGQFCYVPEPSWCAVNNKLDPCQLTIGFFQYFSQ